MLMLLLTLQTALNSTDTSSGSSTQRTPSASVVTDRAEQDHRLKMFATTADRLVTGQATVEPAVSEVVVGGLMIAATFAAEATPAVKALIEVADLHSETETVAIAVEVMEGARGKCVRVAASTAMR